MPNFIFKPNARGDMARTKSKLKATWKFRCFWEFLLRIVEDLENRLTHSFLMHPFSTPWKHQKTLRFSDIFRGQKKGALGTNGLMDYQIHLQHIVRTDLVVVENG